MRFLVIMLTLCCRFDKKRELRLMVVSVSIKIKSIYWCRKHAVSTPGCRDVFRTSRTSKMELFVEIVNDFQPLTIFAKSSILNVRLGSEYTSEIFNFSWTKELTIALMLKSRNQLNYQNGFYLRGMQVRFLLNTYNILIWKYVNKENNVKHKYLNVHHR